jgi:flagellar biogenesis protein FliO
MQFITTLFGDSGQALLNTAFALGAVLVLIVLLLWGLKMLSGRAQVFARTRRSRLELVESVQVDSKRRVLLLRRDNVEHLVLTGGQQDLMIESGIPVPAPAEPKLRRPLQRPAPAQRSAQPAAAEAPPAPSPAPTVPREAVDILAELARPAPLRPRMPTPAEALKRVAAPRAANPAADEVIPRGPTLRVDNSTDAPLDSANSDADGSAGANGPGSRRIGRFSRIGRKGDA